MKKTLTVRIEKEEIQILLLGGGVIETGETGPPNISASEFFDMVCVHIDNLVYNYFGCEEMEEEILAVYAGKLPSHAQRANRRRLVKIFCKGDCSDKRTHPGDEVQWAEMIGVDYPGRDKLKSPEAEFYRAKCLKCGYIAKDPYNWYR